jgi:hypothetical protein
LTRGQVERSSDALDDELRAADAELATAIDRGDLDAALVAIRTRSDRMAAIVRDRIGDG